METFDPEFCEKRCPICTRARKGNRDAAELATHRHFDKFSEDERWVLTTRSGARVAVSSSEVELDQWWRCLKKQRGR
jgi:hypothetical protein